MCIMTDLAATVPTVIPQLNRAQRIARYADFLGCDSYTAYLSGTNTEDEQLRPLAQFVTFQPATLAAGRAAAEAQAQNLAAVLMHCTEVRTVGVQVVPSPGTHYCIILTVWVGLI